MRLSNLTSRASSGTCHRFIAILAACCCALALNVMEPASRALAQAAPAAESGTPLLLAPDSHGSRHGSRRQRRARGASQEEAASEPAKPETEAALSESRHHGRHRHWSRRRGRGSRASAVAATPANAEASDSADAADETPGKQNGPVSVTLLTGALGSTSSRMASDLGAVLDGPTLRVMPMLGKSAGQNLEDLADQPNVDVALVQADTLGGRGKPTGISYIARLYNEEVHVVAGPGITDIRQLSGQRVAVDSVSDESTATASALFARLGIKVIQVGIDLPAALAKLKAGDVAAVLTISGKPSPGLTQFDSTGGYHLVSVPYTGSMQDAYYPGRLDNADYPNLVPAGAGLETVAVGTLLAVHDVPRGSPRYQRLAAFTKAFFARFDALRDPARHPKWREVNLAADVPGWTRFRAATEALAHAPEPAVTAAAKAPTEARSAAGEPSGSTPTGGTRLSGKVDPQNIDLVGRLSRRSGTEHLGRTTEFDRFVASHAAGANISDLSEAQQDRLLREFQKWKRKHRI